MLNIDNGFKHDAYINFNEGRYALRLAILRLCQKAIEIYLGVFLLPPDATGKSLMVNTLTGEISVYSRDFNGRCRKTIYKNYSAATKRKNGYITDTHLTFEISAGSRMTKLRRKKDKDGNDILDIDGNPVIVGGNLITVGDNIHRRPTDHLLVAYCTPALKQAFDLSQNYEIATKRCAYYNADIQVGHINGNKLHNSIDNLEIIPGRWNNWQYHILKRLRFSRLKHGLSMYHLFMPNNFLKGDYMIITEYEELENIVEKMRAIIPFIGKMQNIFGDFYDCNIHRAKLIYKGSEMSAATAYCRMLSDLRLATNCSELEVITRSGSIEIVDILNKNIYEILTALHKVKAVEIIGEEVKTIYA
jgi:hypothetical protein